MTNAIDVKHILDKWHKEKERRLIAEAEWYKCRQYLIVALGMKLDGASSQKLGSFLGDRLKTVKADPWTENDLEFGADPYEDE